jgi:hypothetical protein
MTQPLVQLTRRSTSISTPSEVDEAGDRFAREHALRLRAFLDADLLSFLQRQIEIGGFHEYVHERLPSRPVDLRLNPGPADALLLLLINDRGVLDLMRKLTGCAEIRGFSGSVSRRVPGAGHEDAWHSDAVDGRVAALSVNLGREAYKGGILQIREETSGRIVYELANTGPGDAVLFRIDPRLRHRVTSPTGHTPRTVFAGWFLTQPARELLGLARVSSV